MHHHRLVNSNLVPTYLGSLLRQSVSGGLELGGRVGGGT